MAIIRAFVEPDQTETPLKISDLLDRIGAQAPDRRYLVEAAIQQFRPCLVVNMAGNQDEVQALVKRMQTVSRRVLSVEVELGATIPTDPSIARSAHDLKPEVDLSPYGPLSVAIRQILSRRTYVN